MYQLPRRIWIVGASVLTVGAIWFGVENSAAQSGAVAQRELKVFMRAKLGASEKILEGLCTEDFTLIEKGAAKLQELSSAERWRVSNDAMYRQHSAEFSRAAKQLQKMAKSKKLEGSALAWLQATMSCIECHRWVRSVMVADHETSGQRPHPTPIVQR